MESSKTVTESGEDLIYTQKKFRLPHENLPVFSLSEDDKKTVSGVVEKIAQEATMT